MRHFHDIQTAALWANRNMSGPLSLIADHIRYTIDPSFQDSFPIKFAGQWVKMRERRAEIERARDIQ